MWALYVFGGLAVIITAFLLSDVCVEVTYDHEFLIKAGLWRANRILFPEDRKPEEKKKKKKEKKEKLKEEFKEEEEKPDLHRLALQLRELFKLIGRALKRARLKPCKIHIVAAAEDAAKTAILYGTCCAGLTAVQTVLSELFGRYESDFSVLWDYESKKTSVEADLKIRIRIFWIIVVVRTAVFKYLSNPEGGLKTVFSTDRIDKNVSKTPQKRNKK